MIALPSRLAPKLFVAIGCALLLALLIADRNRWKAKTAHYSEQLAGERAAHSATVASYRAAAERARRLDAENVARVTAEQAQINQRSAHDFESRIAVARAAAERLRHDAQGSASNPGSGGATPLPGLPAAAGSAAQAAGEDRLSEPERLIATEQAIQLDELISWVRAQGRVRVEGTAD